MALPAGPAHPSGTLMNRTSRRRAAGRRASWSARWEVRRGHQGSHGHRVVMAGLLLAMTTLVACSSGGPKYPFAQNNSGGIREQDELYLTTFRYLIRNERWIGTDIICIGMGGLQTSPPARWNSILSTGTTRVVSSSSCTVGGSTVSHRTTRRQAQLIVVTAVTTVPDGAIADAYQVTSPADRERFRCRLVTKDNEWQVERCETRRM